MKSYSKNSCIVIIIALILAFVSFLTLTNLGELFYEEFFPIIVIAVGLIGLISIFIGFAILGQNGIYDAYNDCSQLATIGAALLTILGFFLTIVSGALGIIYFILVAAAIFSLTLMVGGIWCYLNTLHHHNNNCCYRNNM
ncbi:MAG: hypothetical protein ACLRHW_13690 [Coprobacillus cateniformis]